VRIVHRYLGSGPVLVHRDATGDPAIRRWTKEDCAIEIVGEQELLFQVIGCIRLPTG
jgi:hypothetical protein